MKPSAFDYHAPSSAGEAVAFLAELGEGAKVLAGGQSLVPMSSLRLAAFEHLVDIGRIGELAGIHVAADAVTVGAGTTQATIEASAELAAADFFTGFWSTALEPDELLVNVRFPVWTGRCGVSVRGFARRHGDFAVAGAAVAVGLGADDRVERCSISLIGMGSTPIRAVRAEAAVVGESAPLAGTGADEIGAMAVAHLADIPSDLHGSSEYRRRVGGAMVARAWTDAMTEATHG